MTSAETFGLAGAVAWLMRESEGVETIYATALPDGPPLVLRETGALIFTAAAAGGSLDAIVARVCEEVDADPDDIRSDVAAFVEQLVSLGLVARR